MSITRDDVAKLAGVSAATVSYVVNKGPRPVSEDTRQKAPVRQQQIEIFIDVGLALPNSSERAIHRAQDDEVRKGGAKQEERGNERADDAAFIVF